MERMNKEIYRTELTKTRAKILEEMDKYIYDKIGDEDIIDYWLMYGVPDESSYDDLLECAENDNIWLSLVDAFSKCLKLAGVIKVEET